MDDKFMKAVEVVLQHEGGDVNDPNDPGGETKYGISKKSYPHMDIENLTLDQAKEIYYKDWWIRYRINEIKDVQVATKVLDVLVNVGPRTGISILQRALHAAGEVDVVVDGIVGPKTIQATNRANPDMLLGALRAEQANHYRGLVKTNPALAKFETGWLRRAYA